MFFLNYFTTGICTIVILTVSKRLLVSIAERKQSIHLCFIRAMWAHREHEPVHVFRAVENTSQCMCRALGNMSQCMWLEPSRTRASACV